MYCGRDDRGKVVSGGLKSWGLGKGLGNEVLEKGMVMNVKGVKEGKWRGWIEGEMGGGLGEGD